LGGAAMRGGAGRGGPRLRRGPRNAAGPIPPFASRACSPRRGTQHRPLPAAAPSGGTAGAGGAPVGPIQAGPTPAEGGHRESRVRRPAARDGGGAPPRSARRGGVPEDSLERARLRRAWSPLGLHARWRGPPSAGHGALEGGGPMPRGGGGGGDGLETRGSREPRKGLSRVDGAVAPRGGTEPPMRPPAPPGGGGHYLFFETTPPFFVGFVPLVLRPERSTLVALNSPNL
jgi:hypothetical protein